MFFNKKGVNLAIGVMVTAVVLLVVGGVVMFASTTRIRDATDEFDSLLNLNTAECDHDHDGLKDKEDLCPCDDDDFFDSRTYYIANTQCKVGMRCEKYPEIKRTSNCSIKTPSGGVRPETELFEYYIDLNSRECKKAYDNYVAKECKGLREINKEVPFDHACAEKVLAKYKETGRFTFTCKKSVRECKNILKIPC